MYLMQSLAMQRSLVVTVVTVRVRVEVTVYNKKITVFDCCIGDA